MSYRLATALLACPTLAQAEWRHAEAPPTELLSETEVLADSPLLLGLILFLLLFLLGSTAAVILLFMYSSAWAVVAATAYSLLGLLHSLLLSKATRLGGVRKELGVGYSTGFWILTSWAHGFLFSAAGFVSGIVWLSGLGAFAILLAFGLIFLAQKRAKSR